MMPSLPQLPILAALLLVAGGGFFLLDKAAAQARDTTRKHHVEDIEQSLYFARSIHGTYPPYELPTWCGLLNSPANAAVRSQVEATLRQQNEQYANQAKPFPTDPLYQQQDVDYFYWKRSPAVFELYTVLEQDDNDERNTRDCQNAPQLHFDYGLNSRWREPSAITAL